MASGLCRSCTWSSCWRQEGGGRTNAGGSMGGAKISQSAKGLPVHIVTEQIETPPGFIEKLNQHLVLVYTGKTRLARNLLQVRELASSLCLWIIVMVVVRMWCAIGIHVRRRLSKTWEIWWTMHGVHKLLWKGVCLNDQSCDIITDVAHAAPIGDLVELGACLDDYQNQKLVMAPGKADRYNVLSWCLCSVVQGQCQKLWQSFWRKSGTRFMVSTWSSQACSCSCHPIYSNRVQFCGGWRWWVHVDHLQGSQWQGEVDASHSLKQGKCNTIQFRSHLKFYDIIPTGAWRLCGVQCEGGHERSPSHNYFNWFTQNSNNNRSWMT